MEQQQHRVLAEDRFSLLLELITSDVILCVESYNYDSWADIISDVVGVEIEAGEPLSLSIQGEKHSRFSFEILPRCMDLVRLLKMDFRPEQFHLSHSVPGEIFDSTSIGYFDLTNDQIGRLMEVVDECIQVGSL